MPKRSDRELMEAAQGGDDTAFGTLVRRHQQRIYRLALQMLRNPAEAEDVAQEAFVRAYGALARFDGRSQPYTWFYRIAVNLSLNTIRARKRTQRSAPVDDPRVEGALVEHRPDASDPMRSAHDRQLTEALQEGLDQLSETLRTTLLLATVEGLGHGEIAAILGCPEGTVAWRVHEARRKLRASLAHKGHSVGGEP